MPPIESLKQIKDIQMRYYSEAHNAPHKGRLVAYLNVFTPVELLYAMDVFPIYPENHAAVIGVRKMSKDVAPAAEGMGYSTDLCSYPRCDLGSIKMHMSPTWGLPKPDLLVTSNAQCGTIPKWFEVLSRLYNAPMFLIDVPHSGGGEPDPAAEAYVRSQIEDLIRLLEEMSGTKLDWTRLGETIRLSKEATALWAAILESAAKKPSPISAFDQFISMAPIVSQRGTLAAVDFYRAMVEELNDRTANGIGAIENERFRFYWDNLPIWPEMRRLSSFLEERGAALVTSIYTWAWASLAVGDEDPIGDWVRQYLYTFNFHLDKRVDQYAELAKLYQLDGFLYHSNRSCKWLSQDVIHVRKAVTERTGLPGVILDADHNDPRLYSIDSIERQIDSFLELAAARRGE
jgi:benzoyl-CoA reductase/2-hydroxyglutaryl-CoA dehydratase subunit BcrC/BadD/HgdB